MSEWIDVDDYMPDVKDEESSVTVLCWIGPQSVVSGYQDYGEGDWYDQDGELINDVLYWMPHPEDPE